MVHGSIYDPLVESRVKFFDDNEDPIRLINVYGFAGCREAVNVFNGLLKKAGFQTRRSETSFHSTSEVKYENKWHLFDANTQTFFLKPGTNQVEGYEDLAYDVSKIYRNFIPNKININNQHYTKWNGYFYSIYFWIKKVPETQRDSTILKHSMHLVLRPGESLIYRWGYANIMKYRGWWRDNKLQKEQLLYNGFLVYEPRFREDFYFSDKLEESKGKWILESDILKFLSTGYFIIKMENPYLMVGGRLELDADQVNVFFSLDKKIWIQMKTEDFDKLLSTEAKDPIYKYYLKFEFKKGSQIRKLRIINDLQMAPLAMPSLKVGMNKLKYKDESESPSYVRIMHKWEERFDPTVPFPPKPIDYGVVIDDDASFIVLRWRNPKNLPQGDITQYHIEVSEYPDMRYPVIPGFSYSFSTKNKKELTFKISTLNGLEKGKVYYWHVRARNKNGVWGEFSNPTSFKVEYPSLPQNIQIEYDYEHKLAILTWVIPSKEKIPAKFMIYGSDVEGFIPTQKKIKVKLEEKTYILPPNLVKIIRNDSSMWIKLKKFIQNFFTKLNKEDNASETLTFSIEIPFKDLKSFYRIISVDAVGFHSYPSEQIVINRPLIKTQSIKQATLGKPYSSKIKEILPLKAVSKNINNNKIERAPSDPSNFTLVEGPTWLKIKDRELVGIPDKKGTFPVCVEASFQELTDKRCFKLEVR